MLNFPTNFEAFLGQRFMVNIMKESTVLRKCSQFNISSAFG